MSTVPPNSNDPDETPDVAPETSAVPPPAPPAPTQEPPAGEIPGTAAPESAPGAAENDLPAAASPAAPAGAGAGAGVHPGAGAGAGVHPGEGVHAAAPPASDPTASDPTASEPATSAFPAEETAAVPTGGTPAPIREDPATRQLPTEEEDEALRAERARRFGRVASSGSDPVESDHSDTVVAGGAAAGAGAGAGVGYAAASDPDRTTALPADGTAVAAEDDDPFRDFDEGPRSRAAAHWWGILIAVVFGPVTWYLIADGGERISYALSQNLESINVMGLVELGGGLLTLILLLMAARWSSVGSIIIGSIGALIGAAFLVIPQIVADFLASQSMIFDRLGQFGTNVFDHLVADGHSGRLLVYGVAFIFIGVVSHGARRQGRREERRRAALGL
ncbi:hypothetical protein [Ruania zhangjianzhongii]|uniref:hypothetical protein n=1 Tax=Ruania zhangjianzhongii TaxID=2603206 RepID=UPI0011CCACE5|nr:hypothetical protein [Ruania zhangjianzhongii]